MNAMKYLWLGIVVAALPVVAEAMQAGNAVQEQYRWRNDNNTEAAATWKANKNTAITGVTREQNIRLRFVVGNRGYYPPAFSLLGRVEYAESTNGPWRAVGLADTGERFEMGETTWYDGGAPTTTQLGSGTFAPGTCVEQPSNEGGVYFPAANTMAGEYYSELEYCLKAKAKAERNKTYFFRLSNAGAPFVPAFLDGVAYVVYPALTIQDTTLSEPPVIRSSVAAQTLAGLTEWSYEIMASGSEPLQYQAQGLPAGMMLSGNKLVGFPMEYGSFTVTLTVSNAWGVDTAVLPLTVTDPDMHLTAIQMSNPAHGSATLNTNGSFIYTPAAGFSGNDSFTYKANDGALDSNIATVTIKVNATNDAPVAADDFYSLNEDTSLPLGTAMSVLANDAEPEGSLLRAVKTSNPAHGVLSFSTNGMFAYTPTANFYGSDSFTYRVVDGALTGNTATVHLTVNPVNDIPIIGHITNQVMLQDGILNVPFSIVDIDTPPELIQNIGSSPGFDISGNGTNRMITFDPVKRIGAGFTGDFTARVTVQDGPDGWPGVRKVWTDFTITVFPVNAAPVAADNAFSTAPDTVLNVAAKGVLGNDNDFEGATLKAIKVSDASHGSVMLSTNGSFTYTPAAGFRGSDSFTYKANDGVKDSNVATVRISVQAPITNRSPTIVVNASASPAVVTMPAATTLGVGAVDPDGDLLTYTWSKVSGPGTVTFTPNGLQIASQSAASFSQSGGYVLRATISDNHGGAATGSVSVTVNAPAAPLLLTSVSSVSVPEGAVAGFLVRLSVQPVSNIVVTTTRTAGDTNITVQSGGSLTFTRDNWGAFQPVTLAASNDADASNGIATISCKAGGLVTVNVAATEADSSGSVNQPPTANAQSVTTAEDTAKAITLTGSDPEGSALTYTMVSNPAHGTLSGTGASRTYTPAVNYNGADSFTFKVSDGALTSTPAAVSITVTAVNDAPSVTASASPNSGTAPLTVNFTATGADVDGDTLSCFWNFGTSDTSALSAPSYTYTAAGNYTATVTVSDGKGGTASTTVAITVMAPGVSDTTDDHLGTVTAQGENGTTEGKQKAFDNSTATKWLDFANAYPSTRASWIQYAYTNGIAGRLTAYTITSANDAPERDPAAWQLLGSNDGGATWTTVESRSNVVFSARLQKQTFNLTGSPTYKAYRLKILKVANPSTAKAVQLAEIELLGEQVASNRLPIAMAGVNPTSGTTADEFYFWTDSFDPDGTIVAYEWRTGGTLVSTNAEFLYTFATGGTYTVTLTVWDNAGASGSDAVILNVSEPATPVVSVSVLDGLAGESGLATGSGRFQVRRIGNLTTAITVNYAMGGTASNGVDYTLASGTVTLGAGVVSRTVVVDPLPDAVVEGMETAILTLRPGAGYTVDTEMASGTISIQDQTYGTPTVTAVATDAFATEPGIATDKGSIQISRTGSCHQTLTVQVTLGGTAVNGVDYSTVTVPVTLAVGQNAKTITIAPLADGVVEP